MRAIITIRLEREAGLAMMMKKRSKGDFFKAVFGVFCVIIVLMAGVFGTVLTTEKVYADPPAGETTEVNDEGDDETGDHSADDPKPEASKENEDGLKKATSDICKDSLGEMGWLICPITKKISEAVDWLYDKIEGILAIKPISMEDGSPIYEIWKYCLGVANIVFVIFLLVVVYSQITGVGITNYGIKKVLPKLIVMAVVVNLSFLICVLAVDLSNIIGSGLRGVFTSVEETVMANSEISNANISYGSVYGTLVGGGTLALGAGFVAFETGTIWMLIPVLLGAVISVVTGLITIALRQAVVILLIMVAPLAIVASILPNTEQWFKKWKQLLMKMLVFYPMFSLLFGASSLAGFAIMAAAKDGFGIILGMAVQIFPLFFSWKLMQMSGTVLGTINAKMQGLATKPLTASRSFADAQRLHTKQRFLASGRPITPSLRLRQFVADKKIRRDAETGEYGELIKSRAMAGKALENYDKKGNISRKGQRAYEQQARGMRYQQIVEMNKDNFNRGLGGMEKDYKGTIAGMKKDFGHVNGVYSSKVVGKDREERLKYLDNANVTASDDLKFELARGAKIEYDNAAGFQERVNKAMNAHFDQEAIDAGNEKYQLHGVLADGDNMARYKRMKDIMEGKALDVHFAAADAAYAFDSQAQIVRSRFQKYMDLTAPTQDVVHRLQEITSSKSSSSYIDPIIAGLRTLNMRGDTDLVREQLHKVMQDGKVELGTYTSQSLAGFLMFDVKDNDPFLRRFGKYINMETAKMYNEAAPSDRRTRKDVSLYEYVNGEYIDRDAKGEIIYEEDGTPRIRKVKRDAAVLLKGTSFKGMERTAIANMVKSIREYSVDIDENGDKVFNYDKFKKNEAAIWDAIMPNIIGDQFSFLSGSEQIIALGKGITGVDVKDHTVDWKGIFGDKYAELLTPEQQADYLEFLNKRTKTFLGGHVPVQIAKTKTDMLEAVKTQYALWDEIRDEVEYDEDGNIVGVKNPDVLGLSFKGDKAGYDQFEKERFEGIQKEFIGSFKEDALRGFGKMYRKGYQGEAKDGLISLLKPALDKQAETEARSNKKQPRRDNDEEGMPVGGEADLDGADAGSVHNSARLAVEEAYRNYRGSGRQNDVAEFWNEIKGDIMASTSAQTGELNVIIDRIEASLSQFTNVDEFYNYVMNAIFGGY